MVKVYFDYQSTMELIAIFTDDEMYQVCLPGLLAEAKANGGEVVESVEEEEDINNLVI